MSKNKKNIFTSLIDKLNFFKKQDNSEDLKDLKKKTKKNSLNKNKLRIQKENLNKNNIKSFISQKKKKLRIIAYYFF